ncbi:MAG: hypothetical protein IBX56_19975 [Methylomicrobium sp.]|nr:hypothetical protein [Methylomicrobium sp.]
MKTQLVSFEEMNAITSNASGISDGSFIVAKQRMIERLIIENDDEYIVMIAQYRAPDMFGPDHDFKHSKDDFLNCVMFQAESEFEDSEVDKAAKAAMKDFVNHNF